MAGIDRNPQLALSLVICNISMHASLVFCHTGIVVGAPIFTISLISD